MKVIIQPAHVTVAASLDWGAATVGDMWGASDEVGVSAGSVLRALDQLERADAESVG